MNAEIARRLDISEDLPNPPEEHRPAPRRLSRTAAVTRALTFKSRDSQSSLRWRE